MGLIPDWLKPGKKSTGPPSKPSKPGKPGKPPKRKPLGNGR